MVDSLADSLELYTFLPRHSDDARLLTDVLRSFGYRHCADARQYGFTVSGISVEGAQALVAVDSAATGEDGVPGIPLTRGRIASMKHGAALWLLDSGRRGSVKLDYISVPDRRSRANMQEGEPMVVARIRNLETIFSDLPAAEDCARRQGSEVC